MYRLEQMLSNDCSCADGLGMMTEVLCLYDAYKHTALSDYAVLDSLAG